MIVARLPSPAAKPWEREGPASFASGRVRAFLSLSPVR